MRNGARLPAPAPRTREQRKGNEQERKNPAWAGKDAWRALFLTVAGLRSLAGIAVLLLAALRPSGAWADSPMAEALAASYGQERLVILFPADRTTVFDNDGEIEVQWLALLPPDAHPGSRIELLLNGRRIASPDGQHFVLKNLKRGKHRLRARLVSARGATIIDSRPVRFYKWHARKEQQASAGSKPDDPCAQPGCS